MGRNIFDNKHLMKYLCKHSCKRDKKKKKRFSGARVCVRFRYFWYIAFLRIRERDKQNGGCACNFSVKWKLCVHSTFEQRMNEIFNQYEFKQYD